MYKFPSKTILRALVLATAVEEAPGVLRYQVLQAGPRRLRLRFDEAPGHDRALVCDEKGFVDIEKVKPMLFAPEINTYHGVGRLLGRAFSIGKDVRGRK